MGAYRRMLYEFELVNERYAREILSWSYGKPCSSHDEPAEGLLAVLLAPENNYHAILKDGELVGFFCAGPDARVPGGNYDGDALDIGLGLRPDLVGQGLGLGVVKAILRFARERFSPAAFRLTVATSNRRAIRVYERAGFEWECLFEGEGGAEFAQMVREAEG